MGARTRHHGGRGVTEPTQTCDTCGRVEIVRRDGRGFPPDIAKRRLRAKCEADGCPCKSTTYRAGFRFTRPGPT